MADLAVGHKSLIGAITAVGNIAIYNHMVGANIADIRLAEPFDADMESAERRALFASLAFTGIVAVLTRSKEVFIIGGAVILFEDFTIKHANAVNPDTGKMAHPGAPSLDISNVESFPMTDYGYSEK